MSEEVTATSRIGLEYFREKPLSLQGLLVLNFVLQSPNAFIPSPFVLEHPSWDFWYVTLNGYNHPGTPWAGTTGLWWAHGHLGTTGSVTLSTVVQFEQTQRQIVSTVSRKYHHGIGWVVKHTGHVSFEKTLGYWGRFSNLKVSPLQCPVLPTVAAVKTV